MVPRSFFGGHPLQIIGSVVLGATKTYRQSLARVRDILWSPVKHFHPISHVPVTGAQVKVVFFTKKWTIDRKEIVQKLFSFLKSMIDT